MAIILKNDIVTEEETVTISDKGTTIFRGTESDLIQLINDTHAMALAISMDVEAGTIPEDDDYLDWDLYNYFSKKY